MPSRRARVRRSAAVLAVLLAATATVMHLATATGPPGDFGRAYALPAGSSAGAALGGVTVLGLGDSVTAGTACGCRDLVLQYGDLARARTGRAVTAVNMGEPGQTSPGLLRELQRPGAMSRRAAGSGVVLLTIGANDMDTDLRSWQHGGCPVSCWAADAARVQQHVAAIVGEVHRLRAGRPTLVLVTDYWNVFEDGQVAAEDYGPSFAAWSDEVTRAVNTRICAGAVAAGARCADLYAAFKAADGRKDPTALLAEDGDHPDAAGHALIARVLAATGLPGS